MPLDITTTAKEIRQRYTNNPANKFFKGLIIGDKGSGKTLLATTMPKPIIFFSFDPGGTTVIPHELIDSGKILVDNRYEDDSADEPHAYMDFQQEFNRLGRGGFFAEVGSVVIDSLTNLATSQMWRIMQKEGRKLPSLTSNIKLDLAKHSLRPQDWGTMLNNFLMLTRSLSKLPCHVLIVGHVSRVLDAVTQGMVRTVMVPGQAKDRIPINLSEFYVLLVKAGGVRKLLTQHSGSYQATTRMGQGVFEAEEEPNLQALLKKANMNWQDKPLIGG